MGRAPCCDKANVKKGPWSPEEDEKLKEFIDKHGTGGNWIALPQKAGLKRCGKSCRLRWLNYLRPNIKHGEFSEDEDRIICSLYASIGSRWSIIAGQLPGRTDNDIKNYWNTKLRKKLLAMLPSFQKKPYFYPSIPLHSPAPPPLSDNFLNIASSSSFYSPNFMNNVSNNMISSSSLIHNYINVNDLFQPPQPQQPQPSISNTFSGMISNNNDHYLGLQDHDDMCKEYYYPQVKERMLMFGGDQNSNKYHQHRIKQEDQFALEGFGDQTHQNHGFMTDHNNNYVDQKPKGYFKNLEEVKQLIDIKNSSSISVNINSRYLMNEDNDDENKTTHINITDGCYMI